MPTQKIIITDDSLPYLDMMRETLLDSGYQDVTCHTGSLAFEHICVPSLTWS